MNGGFDFGILILGLGALAFLAGLGTWFWEFMQSTKKPSVNMREEDKALMSLLKEPTNDFSLPEIRTRTVISKFLSPPPAICEPGIPSITEFELVAETVDSDETYAESLQDKVEVDEPPLPAESHEASPELPNSTFLTCSGHAAWLSSENDRDSSSISRAIFRNDYNSLIFAFEGFSSHSWPKEVLFSRETESIYTGTAKYGQISVFCSINFPELKGKDLKFEGWWQVDRHDGRKYHKYRINGSLKASRQIEPPDVKQPTGLPAPRVAAAPSPAPAVPHEISIPGRRFSLGYGEFRGRPFIEILENGRPWGDSHRKAKKHFSFGRRKARMILVAKKQIREFVATRGEGLLSTPASIAGAPLLDEALTVNKQDSFRIGAIYLPYPHLKLVHKEESLGIGLSKADALLSLWSKIDEWAKKN